MQSQVYLQIESRTRTELRQESNSGSNRKVLLFTVFKNGIELNHSIGIYADMQIFHLV